MGDSPTPKPPEPEALPGPWAGRSWDAFKPKLPVVVALSGGADSTALLLAAVARWPQQVGAIHIHHGLQTAADAFEVHAQTLCRRLTVPLVTHRLELKLEIGESVEQVARDARYQALSELTQQHWPQAGGVLLAHHADDQVETVLLALLRGAGLPGLAAMPERMVRHGVTFHRPWLQVPAQAIRDWLQAQRETWVEDPSNHNLQHTRNRIRHTLGPVLEANFPAHRVTLGRTARHAAQAQALLDELAADDVQRCGDPPQISVLQGLGEARLANALRFWLKRQGLAASAAQLDELCAQIHDCTTAGHRIELKVGTGQVVRRAGVLVGYNSPLSRGRD